MTDNDQLSKNEKLIQWLKSQEGDFRTYARMIQDGFDMEDEVKRNFYKVFSSSKLFNISIPYWPIDYIVDKSPTIECYEFFNFMKNTLAVKSIKLNSIQCIKGKINDKGDNGAKANELTKETPPKMCEFVLVNISWPWDESLTKDFVLFRTGMQKELYHSKEIKSEDWKSWIP